MFSLVGSGLMYKADKGYIQGAVMSKPEKNILLLEDDNGFVMSQKERFNKEHYSIIHSSMGERAIEIVNDSKEPIDIILIDIDLEERKDITQAVQEIIKNHDVPVLFIVSGTETDFDKKRCGIVPYGYVEKGSSFKSLDRSIKTALKLHKNFVQRFQAETTVKGLSSLFRKIIDFIGEPVLLISTDYRVLMSNQAAKEKYCLDENGGSLYCYKVTHNRSTPCDGISHPCPLKQVEETLLRTSVVHEHVQHNGENRMIELTANPLFDENGGMIGIFESSYDITELKLAEKALIESEETLNTFFIRSLTGFFFMMLDEPIVWNDSIDKEKALDTVFRTQKITKINKAMLEQYISTEDDFIGLTPNDLYKHDIPAGRAAWKELFDKGELHIETDERKFDGTQMFVEGDYFCLYDGEGRVTGHCGVQQDVTKRKQAEGSLKQMVVQKEILMRELQHRVKNNFSVVLSLLSLGSENLSDEKSQRVFIDAQNRIHSMSGIYERLYFSEDLTSVSMEPYIKELAESISQTYNLDSARIKITIRIDRIDLDSSLAIPLGLILNELITNALKYAFPNDRKGEVYIDFKKADDIVTLSVTDNGVGLPENFNIDTAESLGFILVTSLVEKIGGWMSIESKKETRVSVSFKI